MKINPDSPQGQALRARGATADDLEAAGWRIWPFAGALTVALPAGRCLIFTPRSWRDNWPGYLYAQRHELCHVAQARRWGFWTYWRRHIMARVRSRSMLAEDQPEERECYEAER